MRIGALIHAKSFFAATPFALLALWTFLRLHAYYTFLVWPSKLLAIPRVQRQRLFGSLMVLI